MSDSKPEKQSGAKSPNTNISTDVFSLSLSIQFPLLARASLVLSPPLLEQKAADSFQIW